MVHSVVTLTRLAWSPHVYVTSFVCAGQQPAAGRPNNLTAANGEWCVCALQVPRTGRVQQGGSLV